MKVHRIFISHSSVDREFANLVAARLREADMEPWVDNENILVGDDILDSLGSGLRTMDLFVLIVSEASLSSSWVERELKFAVWEEVRRKQALVLPFIIDESMIDDLPWYIRNAHNRRISRDASGADSLAAALREAIDKRPASYKPKSDKDIGVQRDTRVDKIIRHVGLGDWESAAHAALEIVRATPVDGRNQLFHTLIDYIDLHEDDDLLWSALHTIECYAELAPPQVDRALLIRMASHPVFSVRSAAASICMRWAQFAPDRIPIDILLKLSAYDEDWYVERPANAALKTMARSVREVLSIFFARYAVRLRTNGHTRHTTYWRLPKRSQRSSTGR